MGYLSNKKHKARVGTVLKVFLLLAAIITLFGYGSGKVAVFFDSLRWQLYMFLLVVLFYTLLKKHYIYASLFFLLGMINFFTISSAVNVFAGKANENSSLELLFAPQAHNAPCLMKKIKNKKYAVVASTNPDMNEFELEKMIPAEYKFLHSSEGWENGFMLSSLPVKLSGRVNLGSDVYADFVKIDSEGLPLSLIAVDFSKLDEKQISFALNNLSAFVARQDDPVVIFGDFNRVGWSKAMTAFIEKNGLKVKNALNDNIRNLFIPQHYYILGYEHSGIKGYLFGKHLNSLPLFTRF